MQELRGRFPRRVATVNEWLYATELGAGYGHFSCICRVSLRGFAVSVVAWTYLSGDSPASPAWGVLFSEDQRLSLLFAPNIRLGHRGHARSFV